MSEADRQRRLHVQNRLEELNAKYGPVADVLPDWLDHMPEPSQNPEDPLPAQPEATPPKQQQTPPRRKPPTVWERP